MKKRIYLSVFAGSVFLMGCAGSLSYTLPEKQSNNQNSVTVNKPIDAVWKGIVPELGKKFFVINNLDKSSGLINISYTGDPEKYIDCGRINSYVKNARGERTYDFPAAKAQQTFEQFDGGTNLFFLDRKMSLDGRMNLVFEEISPNETKVTANTKYIVNKVMNIRNTKVQNQTLNDTISFNSGQSASFPVANSNRDATTCQPTGIFETDVLSLIK